MTYKTPHCVMLIRMTHYIMPHVALYRVYQKNATELLMITTQSKLMYVLKGHAEDPAIERNNLIML